MTLILEKKILEEIMRHAEETYPHEACGIMAGRREEEDRRLVLKIYKTTNVLHSPSAYSIDPEEQYAFFLKAEGEGLEVVGFYHSHPYWASTPSASDRAQAYYPDHSYSIYSNLDKTFKSYVLRGESFILETVIIH